MLPPRRPGAIRGETLGYAFITFLLLAGVIYTLRMFTVPERADLAPTAPPASVPAVKPAAPTAPAPAVPLAPPPRPYTQTLAQDRQMLPGVWVRPRNTEARGGTQPGLRLRFAAEQVTVELLDPNDPPLPRNSYRYDVLEQDGVRYLKLTVPDTPEAGEAYVAYRIENNALELESARLGQMEQDKLTLGNTTETGLLGVLRKEGQEP